MGARLNIIQSNPRDKMDAMVFAKSNIFLTPPLKRIVPHSPHSTQPTATGLYQSHSSVECKWGRSKVSAGV